MKNIFIVATISDINCDKRYLKKLFQSGVTIVRLNTAHQSFEGSRKIIESTRTVAKEMGLNIEIMVDTKGPEIRTLDIDSPIKVETGEIIELAIHKTDLNSKGFCVNYKNILNYAKPEDLILIDDGEIELIVLKKKSKTLLCKAANNGFIENKKSVNVPGMKVDLPTLTDKDKDYIRFAISENAEYIAHSFVRSKEDVFEIHKIYKETDKKNLPKIYAKIENQEGVQNIEEIIEHTHGIIVARGDLGNEIPLEDLPYAQKLIIKKSNSANKPVVVATQMIHSMCTHPRPTRAEITDIANAVLDGADGTMLSGETTHGKYPIQAVQTMKKIVDKYVNGLEYISNKTNGQRKTEIRV